MKSIPLTYISYAALTLAIFAWTAVFYEGTQLTNEAADRAATAATVEQLAEKRAYAARLNALAADTKDERAQIERIVQTDVVTIANTIEAMGKSAGVSAQVSDALPENGGVDLPGGGKIQPIAFIVQASGSFQSLMRLASLYEHISLPSQVQQLDIEKSGGADPKAPAWRMTIRIRVFTSATISS